MEIKNKKIFASLTYGKPFGVLGTVIISLITVALDISFIMLIITREKIIAENELTTFIILCVGALCLFALCVFVLIQNIILNSRIKNWVKDSVELRAKISFVGTEHLRVKRTKILVSFSYLGRKIKKFSGDGKNSGYSSAYNRLIDKEVNILYSPTYDQVLLLKD